MSYTILLQANFPEGAHEYCRARGDRVVTTDVRPILPLTLHPTNIARLKLSGKSPMGLGFHPFKLRF